jgi:hypothetical protein
MSSQPYPPPPADGWDARPNDPASPTGRPPLNARPRPAVSPPPAQTGRASGWPRLPDADRPGRTAPTPRTPDARPEIGAAPAGPPPAGPPPGGAPSYPTPLPSDRPDDKVSLPPDAVRVGLWGAAGGGKTTFLAAMQIATFRGCTEPGGWTMLGTTDEASEFLEQSVRRLTREREFPEASAGIGQWIRWQISGTVPATTTPGGKLRRMFGNDRGAPGAAHSFGLELLDVPGQRFRFLKEDDGLSETCLEHMSGSDGLIYLFDPTLDLEPGKREPNLEYVYVLLNRMKTRLHRRGGLDPGGRLPHHIAVCVTKFDDPEIFDWANESGLVTTDEQPPHLPRVTDPEQFFGWLCHHMRESGADLLREALTNAFHPDRIRYYVLSSIGFRLSEDGVFDPADPANVRRHEDRHLIRGQIHPMNILEPLIQLERKIRTGSWSR